jgi:ribosomal protein S2
MSTNQNKTEDYKIKLVNYLVENNLYFGNKELQQDLRAYTIGVIKSANRRYQLHFFDVNKQLQALMRVYGLLKFLKSHKIYKRRPLLFFGLNTKGVDFGLREKILSLNKNIFKLCFSYRLATKKKNSKKAFDHILNTYYSVIYASSNKGKNQKYEGNIKKITYFFNYFFGYKNSQPMDTLPSKKDIKSSTFMKNFLLELSSHGLFFDTWASGFYSNYRFLHQISRTFTLSKQQSIYNLSLLQKSNTIPAAAIFFSSEGYENCFKELNKMGIPIICIVNTNNSLDYVDYPLFGDGSRIKVLLFYIFAIKEALSCTTQQDLKDTTLSVKMRRNLLREGKQKLFAR